VSPRFLPGGDECQVCGKTWYGTRCYVLCFECGHVYRTRWHLLAAYRHMRLASWRRYGHESHWAWAYLCGWWRPSRISFCQCCIHDF
jgi:hypothetical protein